MSYAGSRRGSVVGSTATGFISGKGTPAGNAESHPGSITIEQIDDWHDELEKDPTYALAKTVLSRMNMNFALQSRQEKIHDQMIFSDQISYEGEPVTNQLSSGRCWLFATCNVTRIFTARKYNLEKFQLSQSYLFFYDHLSKANWFLEQVMDTIDEPLDSRTVAYLFSQAPAQDGGQWDLAVNLVANYGLCPQVVFPESFNSSNSATLDALLTSKLREMALRLRKTLKQDLQQMKKRAAISAARELKDDMLKEIYRILTITCGTPPKPDEKFVWEFVDKNKKVQRIITTPLEFAEKHAGYDVSDTISVLNDPRNKYEATYTVERLGNVVGGREMRYLNMPSKVLADLAISILKSNVPVWFGCDVDKASNTGEGIMDVRLFEYNEAFGTQVRMNKKQRLLSGDSSMTHAMMLTGVHLDPETGNPVRWRVENSWGPEACNKGFLVMTHAWFEAYVFQIVAPRSYVPHELLDIYDHSPVTSLPPWDVLVN
ncbi:bleomycin hydrolase [Rhodosporidiobolus nylandii]